MADEEKKVPTEATTAAAWKREEAEIVELPSGNAPRLMRPQMMTLIRNGQIPNPLLQAAGAVEVGQIPDDFVELLELTDILVSSAFVEPKCVLEKPGPGEIAIEWLSDPDKTFVAAWIKQDVEAMSTFRGERSGPDSGQDSGTLRDAA